MRATVSPDYLRAGSVVNVIPATAEALVDVRRMPGETKEEVLARLREIVHDNQVEILPAPGHDIPAAPPSSTATALYRTMESVFRAARPGARVIPYMQRGGTDGCFLRQKGMPVYGAPLFAIEDRDNHAHGADERISLPEFDAGVELLWRIVVGVAGK